MVCSKCGSEIQEGSKFCNNCGNKILIKEINDNEINIEQEKEVPLNENVLQEDKDDISNNTATEQTSVKKKNIISRIMNISIKRKFILGLFLLLIIVVGVGYKIIEPPSSQKVFETVKSYNSDQQISYLNKVYPINGGFLGLFKEKDKQNKVAVLDLLMKNIDSQFQTTFGRSISDYSSVKILHVDIENESYSSDYANINVTVNNGGTTAINYIKINLYFKDENGNIIRSEFTNDNSNIQPGANQVLTDMTKNDGWKKVSAEIAEIK